uniref:mevalonate kinase n=1 Tax=Astyanax mexicanus TaxID=7994 RepID=A0A3B1IP47_ASTMX
MQVKQCFVSAPGKSILHGEHAVVHGKVALAVSLNLRTYLRLLSTTSGEVTINLPNIDTFLTWDVTELQPLLSVDNDLDLNLVKKLREFTGIAEGSTDTRSMAVLAFLYIYLSVFSDADVCVWSELPTGAGLGSSAAFSVCLSAALLSAGEQISTPLSSQQQQNTARWTDAELELINKWHNHLRLSVCVCVWCVCVFSPGNCCNLVPRVPTLRILLSNTKVPRSTKVLVSGVKDKINKYPSIITPVLESVDAVSKTCEQTLAAMATDGTSAKHYSILEDLIDINQHHLNVMGVGHPSLDTLCRVTLAHGLHSKLTGAGGGGCGITLLRPGNVTYLVFIVNTAYVQDIQRIEITLLSFPNLQQVQIIDIIKERMETLCVQNSRDTNRHT